MKDVDVARLLAIGKRTVWRKVSTGEIPRPLPIQGMARWSYAEIKAYVDRLSA